MITFGNFIDLYDNWNGYIKINDKDLNEIIKCYVGELVWYKKELNNLYEHLKSIEVISFGFYDNELCVRVSCSIKDIKGLYKAYKSI